MYCPFTYDETTFFAGLRWIFTTPPKAASHYSSFFCIQRLPLVGAGSALGFDPSCSGGCEPSSSGGASKVLTTPALGLLPSTIQLKIFAATAAAAAAAAIAPPGGIYEPRTSRCGVIGGGEGVKRKELHHPPPHPPPPSPAVRRASAVGGARGVLSLFPLPAPVAHKTDTQGGEQHGRHGQAPQRTRQLG